MLQIFFFSKLFLFFRIYNNEVHYTDSVSVHIQHIKIRRFYISFFFPLIECKSDASQHVNKVNCCSQNFTYILHQFPHLKKKIKKGEKINKVTKSVI